MLNTMYRVITFKGRFGFRSQTEIGTLISYLKEKGYLPVIRSMFSGLFYLTELGNPIEELLESVFPRLRSVPPFLGFGYDYGILVSDLLCGNNLVYALIPLSKDTHLASVIGYSETVVDYDKNKEALERFCADIEKGIKARFDGRRVRFMKFGWEPICLKDVVGSKSRTSELASRKPNYSSKDAEVSEELIDKGLRQLIQKIGKRGQVPCDGIPRETLEHAITLDLIGRKIQGDCTLTKRGTDLINGSKWMSVWVTKLLKGEGVRRETIRWNVKYNSDELDIMVEDFCSRILFELKDKEFGLGYARHFIPRISKYDGIAGIVATMDKVAPDARTFLNKARKKEDIKIEYFEGANEIREGIAQFIENTARAQAQELVQIFSNRVRFVLWPIIERWMKEKNQ